ncbi:Uncharacterised protein [Neisseria animaloris]|nr:hypothetical protein [Neisseria animaloris]OSI06824.1 hypothetical protein BWD08_10650 [Neisseria animaloris]VEH86548.1 Uncharacterised protein [Neisseria animaloris]
MAVDVRVDLSRVYNRLDDIHKRQLPFAAKNALNKTAEAVIAGEQSEMQAVFFNPTRWTMNSLFVRQYAQKENLTAVVDFKDAGGNRSAGKYLAAQIHGGSRRTKAVESFFVAKGLMPAGHRIVPAAGARLDRHGNITLTAFRSMVRGVSDGTHFVLHARRGKLPAGLYKRKRSGVTPLLVYVSAAAYDKLFRYFETAQRVVDQDWQRIFDAELAHALATAR